MPHLIDPVQDQGIVSIRSGGTTYSIGDLRGEGIIMDDHPNKNLNETKPN